MQSLFSRNIQYYIILALQKAGVSISGDTYAELGAAFGALESELADIKKRLAALEEAADDDGEMSIAEAVRIQHDANIYRR